jgi:hypothetical protein
MNIDTAIAQQLVNQTNQVTPEGSLTYNTDGSFRTFVNSDGKTVRIPNYTATQSLSPSQQNIYDIGQQTETNLATMGRDQSAKISELLSRPVDLSNEAAEARLYELGSKRLEPQFARDEESLRTRLINQGIRVGSDAYDDEMKNFDFSRNDARNQLALTGRGQALSELLQERNQPINEITALMSGSQVSQPSWVGTPQAGVANTDYAGMVRDKYQADLAAAQMKAQHNQAIMGGLFGLAGAGVKGVTGMYSPSSRDYKTAGEDAGSVLDKIAALPVERWRYKPEMNLGEQPHIGPYAEDFRDAFGVGDGKTIAFVDMMGVLFKGLQELTREVRALKEARAA